MNLLVDIGKGRNFEVLSLLFLHQLTRTMVDEPAFTISDQGTADSEHNVRVLFDVGVDGLHDLSKHVTV